jgi:alanyl-tRNA synthetase
VTERLYFHDARTTSFEGKLVALTTDEGRPAAILDATYFFPTSGGQPHDTGTLGGVRVVDVVERGDDVLHILEAPLEAYPGDRLPGRIDEERRRDYLRQHTGQHVLSQAFERVLGARTVSVHFGEEECTVDVAIATLAPEGRDRVAALANAVVMDDRPVRVHLLPPGEAARRFSLRRPPQDEPAIRVVEIEDFDASACCGTHASRTGEIGPIAILGWERGKAGQTRVRFVCGERAVRALHRKTDLVNRLVAHFMVPEERVLEAAKREAARVAALERERVRAREARLASLGRSLHDAAPEIGGVRLVASAPADLEPAELAGLARAILACGPAVACLGAAAKESASLLVACPEGSPVDARALLEAALAKVGGRGGGKPTQAQGAGPRVERLADSIAAAQATARARLEER